MMEREITQNSDNAVYIEENKGNIYYNTTKTKLSPEEIKQQFETASIDLSGYNNKFANTIHLPREETNWLYDWINSDLAANESPIAILGGNAGYGKSVILSDLYDLLNKKEIPVLGIKADRLAIRNLSELNSELALGDTIEAIFKRLNSSNRRFVFIIDQIDALSQSLSSDRNPLQTYNRLILVLSRLSNIRIVISCRLYDLDYDPLLQEYKNKKVFRTGILSLMDVERVLNELGIPFKPTDSQIKDFLRIPLHLQLFCKINNPSKFDNTISLQTLYDEIWRKFVLEKPRTIELDPGKIQHVINEISEKMYDKQQLVVSKKLFESKFASEINYLSTEEIIMQQENNKLQFMHQSFFDYAYARTFIEKGTSISQSLNEQHQGLFIRSRVKQVFTYLRELDEELYICELTEMLLGEYRFHLKLLLLNSLGFYSNPLACEKTFVKTILTKDETLLKLFFESIYTEEWFDFCINEMDFAGYFCVEDEVYVDIIYRVCWNILSVNPEKVIRFLETVSEIECKEKVSFIGNLLSSLPPDKIGLSYPLFLKTKNEWSLFNYYHYLRALAVSYPEWTMHELDQKLDEYLLTAEKHASDYLPGGHDGFQVYEVLFDKHRDGVVQFFIRVTDKIAETTKITYLDEKKNKDRIFQSWAYYLYSPHNRHHYNHQGLYDKILTYLDEIFRSDFHLAKSLVIPLLDSHLDMIVNLPIIYLSKYPDKLKEYAIQVLTTSRYYNTSSEHVIFNMKELIKAAYPLLDETEQLTVNQTILSISPEWEKKNLHDKKGVTKYGYTRIGYTSYGYIAMIPEADRKKYPEADRFYKEKNRQYGEATNEKPQGVITRSGEIGMSLKAYEKMTDAQWKDSFRKYTSDSHFDWNIPTLTGHSRQFEKYVSNEPYRYISLIEDIIDDYEILPIYAVYGLQGLTKGNCNAENIRELFLKFIDNRYHNNRADRESLIYVVWLIDYFIQTATINKEIIDFLCDIVIHYEDGEMLNNDPINDGINSVRGASCSVLIECHKFPEFKEEIFSALEYMATHHAAVHTRGAALYKLAYLNSIDKERNLKLYLALMQDCHPLLLKIPLNNIHPLIYMIHVDFESLVPFFQQAITVEEAKEPMAHILFIAWLNDYANSKELLDSVLVDSISAQKKVVSIAFDTLKNNDFKDKCWEIIYRYINVDNEEMGKEYEFGINDLECIDDSHLIGFLNTYVKSSTGKYRGHYFYDLLLKKTKDLPKECIMWTLSFEDHEKPDITKNALRNEPLQIIIQSYNAIREYNKKDTGLETAMEAFDRMLKVREYRRGALDVLAKIDA